MLIKDVLTEYEGRIDSLDLDLIVSDIIKKPREFVLAHPEASVNKKQESVIIKNTQRRINHEPLAYILGHKEFFGLDFEVNKNVLIPRPETELLVERVLQNVERGTWNAKHISVIDIGTGSGNIIISLAKNLKRPTLCDSRYTFYGIDASEKALRVAKKNARKNKTDKKIKFMEGNLLEPFLKNIFSENKKIKSKKIFITANLPYLSKKNFFKAMDDVKKFEPKKALLSSDEGLGHYIKIFKQLKKIKSKKNALQLELFFEISPEQKTKMDKIANLSFPDIQPIFHKDLAGKWRVFEAKI